MQARTYAGFSVVVENPAGSTRQWYDRDGQVAGSTTMLHDYGYFAGHAGSDGDELDVYLGPDEAAPYVHVVHQRKAPEFTARDEDKVMLGFGDEAAAKAAYLAHRNDGHKEPGPYGGMSVIPLEQFRAKLSRRTGDGKIRHGVPMDYYVLLENGDVVGRLLQFDNLRGADGKVRTGLWDYICVEGEDLKPNGKELQYTRFDSNTLSQMVDNLVRRGDKIPIDWNHQSNYAKDNGQPAPALGFYTALAVVFNGVVIKFGTARGYEAVQPPAPAGLENGLYGCRGEVTEIGDKLLPGFAYVSPTFTPTGTDRLSNPTGYMLAAVAATNTPWQSGTRISFENGAPAPATPNPDPGATGAPTTEGDRPMAKLAKMSKFVKFEEGADDDKIKQAVMAKMGDEAAGAVMAGEGYDFGKHAATLEDMAKCYEDAHMEDDDGDEPPHFAMRKMAAKFRGMAKMAEPTPEEEKPGAEMAAFAQGLGIDCTGKTSAQVMDAVRASTVPAAKIPDLVKAQVAAAMGEAQAQAAAREAARAGAVLMEHLGRDYPGDREALARLAQRDPAEARKLAQAWLPQSGAPAALFDNLSAAGAPRGQSGRTDAGPKAPKVVSAMGRNFIEVDGAYADAIKETALSKVPVIMAKVDGLLGPHERGDTFMRLRAAEKVVKMEQPDLLEFGTRY